jgi:hypothetical protein
MKRAVLKTEQELEGFTIEISGKQVFKELG